MCFTAIGKIRHTVIICFLIHAFGVDGKILAQTKSDAACREFFQISTADTRTDFAFITFFRQLSGDFVVNDINHACRIARAVQQGWRTAQHFNLFCQDAVYHYGVVGRHIGHIACFGVIVQHANAFAFLTANNRRTRSSPKRIGVNAQFLVEGFADGTAARTELFAFDNAVAGFAPFEQVVAACQAFLFDGYGG